jgi:hypothetical protein
MPLNQAQSLSLATTLQLLEERCEHMHRLIAGAEHDGVLLHTLQDIPADARPALLDELTALRSDIAHLTTIFHLDATPHSAHRILVALLATNWQDLEDERPTKLGRYGPVDPAVTPALDAGITQLIARIKVMESLLDGNTMAESAADVIE